MTSAPHAGPGPVFIVEDDADTRECLGDILSEEGYSVYTAANGLEALALLSGIPAPCLILLDLMMPGMNGWDFLEAMRGVPGVPEVPVVIVSAYEAPAGYPVLRKPVSLDELLRVVERHCGLP